MGVDVRVEDFGCESDRGRLVGIVGAELDVKEEEAALVRTVLERDEKSNHEYIRNWNLCSLNINSATIYMSGIPMEGETAEEERLGAGGPL